MNKYSRDLHIIVNEWQIGQGCRMILNARQSLTLRPALHHLEIYDLSDSSAAMLSGSSHLEVVSGKSVLSAGEITEVYTRRISGNRLTSVVFSPGLSLWQSSVSLSLSSGLCFPLQRHRFLWLHMSRRIRFYPALRHSSVEPVTR